MKIKWIHAALLTVLLFGVSMLTSGLAAVAGEIAVIKAEVVNVRSGPNTASNVLTQASRSEQLPITAKSGDWCQVKLPNGATGWVAGWLVEIKQDAGSSQTVAGAQVTVTGEVVNIRSGPGTNYGLVGQATKASVLPVLEQNNDWYKVQLSNGASGWVAGWLVEYKSVPPPAPAAQPATQPAAQQTTSSSPATPNSVGRTGVIAEERVNIRSGPGTDNDVVKEAVRGSSIVVLQQSGDWYRVKLQDGAIGWVASWLVTLGAMQTQTQQASVVTVSRGNQEPASRNDDPAADVATPYSSSGNPNDTNNDANKSGDSNSDTSYNSRNKAIYNDADTPYSSKGSSSSSSAANNNVTSDKTQDQKTSGKAVELQINANGDVVTGTIRADADVSNYNTFYLSGPSRFVVDITGITPGSVSPDKIIDSRAVSRVRVGYQQHNPDITRIVFELNSGVLCLESVSADKKTLTVKAIVPNVQGVYRGKSVTIDPGHGGSDPGAIGKSGVQEKELTLDIAKQVSEMLVTNGARVTMTRSGDKLLGLYEIADVANSARTDVFVSIHINASTKPAVGGTTTYIHNSTDEPGHNRIKESDVLAKCVQNELARSLGLRDVGVEKANFVVLRATNMPAILVEVAFISNAEEEQLLNTPAFRKKAAEAIVNGIGTYFAVKDIAR